jgi:hypothetical protein
MRKLKLEIEELSVETFAAADTAPERGTAVGHAVEMDVLMGGATGVGGWTGMETCEGESCLQTCTFDTCLSCTATQEY